MKSILDPSYKYRNAASHGDPEHFRRRMRARVRIAQAQRKTEQAKVTKLRKAAP